MKINYLNFNKDPWGALGALAGAAYGSIWANNAEKRQEEKAHRIISDLMGGNVTSEDVNAAITSGTGVLGQQNQVTAQDVQAAIRGWPVGLTADAMRNNLRKNNINQEVIDKVMPGYEKQMREAMTAKFLPQIMGSLYGENTDYGNAMQQVIALSKYDPDTAKLLMSGIPTGKDVLDYNRAVTVKGMGLGDFNKGKTQYSVSTSDYNAYVNRMNAIEKFYDEQKMMNESYELPDELRTEYNTLAAMKQTYLSEHANQLPGFAVQQTAPAQQMQQGQQAPVAQPDTKRQTPVAPQPQEVEPDMFADQAENRAGLVQALGEGKTFKQWLDEVFGKK